MDYKDIAYRAFWTFAQAFFAVVIVGQTVSVKAAGIAGLAAVASLGKNLAAQKLRRWNNSV